MRFDVESPPWQWRARGRLTLDNPRSASFPAPAYAVFMLVVCGRVRSYGRFVWVEFGGYFEEVVEGWSGGLLVVVALLLEGEEEGGRGQLREVDLGG